MSNEQSADYWAQALAEVEADIAKLQAMADMIRERMAKRLAQLPEEKP
jgi:predicted ATP-grasp superfamily ATP-dependent carboligase